MVPAVLALADPRSQRLYRGIADKAAYSRIAAIKLFCIECMGYSRVDAKRCDNSRCPLWSVSNKCLKRSQEIIDHGNAAASALSTNASS